MQARGEKLGPLHGLPVAHKDLLETRGIRTTFGSPLYKDNIPTEDDHRRRTDAARGRDHDRQDQHAGIRRGIADVQHGLRRDAQSLRPDEDVRRIVRRRRRRVGLRTGACRQRLRYRRFAAQSRRILQRRRLPAFDRPRAESEGGVRVVDAEHLGMPGAFGGRPCPRAEHDRRARFPRAALHRRTGRTLRAPARPQLQRRARGLVQGSGRRALRPARPRRGGRASQDLRIPGLHRRAGRAGLRSGRDRLPRAARLEFGEYLRRASARASRTRSRTRSRAKSRKDCG